FLSQPEKFPSDEGIKTGLRKSASNLGNSVCHDGIFRVVPDQLAIEILQQNGGSGLCDSHHFRDCLFFLRKVLKKHSCHHHIECSAGELHLGGIAAKELQLWIIHASFPGLFNASLADVDSRGTYRWMKR